MSTGGRVLLAHVAAAAATLAVSAPSFAAPAGTVPLLTSGSTNLGAAAQSRTIALVLAPGNPAGLRAFLAGPHAQLTPVQFTARFGPSAATVSAITSWAAAHRLSVASVSSNRLVVRVSAGASALGTALGVVFDRFRAGDGSTYVSSVGRAALPASIAGHVAAIVGLSDLGRSQHDALINLGGATAVLQALPALTPAAPTTLSFPASYGPQDLWSLYDAPAAATGAGQTVSVIAEGDVSQPQKDLAQFERQFGLPPVAWHQINVGSASSDTSGDDEWDLDTQYSTGFAPGVSQVNVYVSPSMNDPDILTTINRWVSDDASKQASFSAGECELLADVGGFMAGLDPVLAEAAAQGQTLFTSSGDTGSQCPALVAENGVPLGLPGVSYPASSPYAIGVGGTTVLGAGPTEIAWYAGGGGSSILESTPAWQQGAGGSFLGLERGVPDVALDADPNSGYDVIVGGTAETIGGTSAGAPSWQGIWARAQAAHGGGLGFAGPVIYGELGSAFHDIILGANVLYVATPGWDYTTGRGTPDISAFVNGA